MEHLHMMTVLVRNKSGVLQRITGLFSRRGYNIQSIYAEQTEDPAVSRVLIEVAGDDFIISQVKKQLTKLVDVLSVNEAATASFELAALKQRGQFQPFFELISFKVIGEKEHSAAAIVKIRVGDQIEIAADEGEGPVHALDVALRKAVGRFYPALDQVKLTDYKVRVLDPQDATAATGRVLLESTDGNSVWSTVGISRDLIDASLQALVDSIEYKLLLDSRAAEGKENKQ